MNRKNLEQLSDVEVAEYAVNNVAPQYMPIVEELYSRMLSYSDTMEAMAAIMGISVEQLKILVQVTSDPEFNHAKMLVVVRKFMKEL